MSIRRRSPLLALACMTALGLARSAIAAAPPLADRVPADALVYLGWTGSTACPGYDGSHLKNVIDKSSLPEVFTSFVPQLVRRVARLDGEAGQAFDQVVNISSPMWRHPTAFYFGGVDLTGGRPMPKLALMCDAGRDGPGLARDLRNVLAKLPPDADPKPVVTEASGLVILSFAEAMPAGGLSKVQAFTTSLAQCRPDGAAVVGYLDIKGIVTAVDGLVAQSGNPDAATHWPKIRQGLGLGGFKQVAMTAGFDGKDWVEREFAGTDGTHAGLLSLLDARPLDTDLLSVVPRTADRVAASRLDLAAAFDAIHDAIPKINPDPDVAQQMDQAIDQVNQMAGVNVRRDLLGSLGDQWVTYADRGIGGSGLLGSVLVNRLRDPARFDDAMTQVSRRANFIIANQLKSAPIEIQFREQAVNGLTLHYLAIPLVTPTWAVKGNTLYVGLYPQVVTAAVDEAATHKQSILQRPEFLAVMHRLGDHPAASLSFTNIPAVAPDGYADLLAATRMYLGMGDLFGAHAPPLVVPPLGQIMPELAPAGSVSWADAAGWHAMAVSPFPGAEILASGGGGGGSVFQQFMLLGMMGQGMERARLAR